MEPYAGADRFVLFDPDGAVVVFDDAVGDGETDAGAFVGAGWLDSLEHVEDAVLLVRIDADPVVGDVDPPPVVPRRQR